MFKNNSVGVNWRPKFQILIPLKMFGTTMIQNVEISTADFTLIEAIWVECKFVLKRCIAKLYLLKLLLVKIPTRFQIPPLENTLGIMMQSNHSHDFY
jgi:hypothetical protein